MTPVCCWFCRLVKAGTYPCVHCSKNTCLDCHHGRRHVDRCIGVRRELPHGVRR